MGVRGPSEIGCHGVRTSVSRKPFRALSHTFVRNFVTENVAGMCGIAWGCMRIKRILDGNGTDWAALRHYLPTVENGSERHLPKVVMCFLNKARVGGPRSPIELQSDTLDLITLHAVTEILSLPKVPDSRWYTYSAVHPLLVSTSSRSSGLRVYVRIHKLHQVLRETAGFIVAGRRPRAWYYQTVSTRNSSIRPNKFEVTYLMHSRNRT